MCGDGVCAIAVLRNGITHKRIDTGIGDSERCRHGGTRKAGLSSEETVDTSGV